MNIKFVGIFGSFGFSGHNLPEASPKTEPNLSTKMLRSLTVVRICNGDQIVGGQSDQLAPTPMVPSDYSPELVVSNHQKARGKFSAQGPKKVKGQLKPRCPNSCVLTFSTLYFVWNFGK